MICFIPNQQNLLSSMQSADQVKFLMNNNSVVKPECTCLFQPGSVPGHQKENKKELEEKIMEVLKQIPEEESKSNFWHYTKVISGGVVAGGLAVAAAPLVLSVPGFTAGGIGAGSVAAQWMSWTAIANGGGVAAGGLFSALQSAGMAGISTATNLLIGTAAGTAGGALTKKLSDREKARSSEESEHQCIICLDSCEMNTALKPCGHQFTCKFCAEMLRKCPICKIPIQK